MEQRPTYLEKANGYFSRYGLSSIRVPVLQPADPFLDMVGEDLRRRIFMTENEHGDSLCLRPEFTIPVCLHHIASGQTTPRLYAYSGEVFRQGRRGAGSFYQAGIEELGAGDEAAADARSLMHATAMMDTLVPEQPYRVLLGDQTVFAAVLDALLLPRGWQKKLLRCFGNTDQVRALLAGLASPVAQKPLAATLEHFIAAHDMAGLIHHLEQEMLAAGISPSAGRTPQDIATRLVEKQAYGTLRLEKSALAALEDFLAIQAPLDRAGEQLAQFAARHALALDGVIAGFAARVAALRHQGLAVAEIAYDAAFGRPLDYYTGLVYELRGGADGRQVLAGGGRYDRLLTLLGADMAIPAIGFSIWLDRLGIEAEKTAGESL